MHVIRSENGFHLVQVNSRVHPLFADEIKQRVVQTYSEELFPQAERYVLIKKLFYEVDLYFK